MRRARWMWPPVVFVVLGLGSWLGHAVRPARALDVVVLDKTVPFRNRIEHRSLFWLFSHLKIRRPDGRPYDAAVDYLGAYPPLVPGDPPERTADLPADRAMRADLLYLADTYGVYVEDLASGPAMKAALERSPKIYGGLLPIEAHAAARYAAAGGTLVAEFNSFASPTGEDARRTLESVLGVRWTRWIGRYFPRLEDEGDVPRWLVRVWEREWSQPWEFRGPGYVLLQEDRHCEVLRVGVEAERRGLILARERPADPLLAKAGDVAYPYWFDVVTADPDARVAASYRWRLTDAGLARLQARGLPERFPAVTRRELPGGGIAFYFAGDFADNPMSDRPVPFAGYLTLMQWLEAVKLAPSETEFYWRFYVPMMEAILEGVGPRPMASGAERGLGDDPRAAVVGKGASSQRSRAEMP